MTQAAPWLLPDGVEELLPEQAERLEEARRQLIDLYYGWGYELVIPPFIEFTRSLLTGTGASLDVQTFKVTDQLSGRLMAVRSDMTPQMARIDAHSLGRKTPTRLCYLGSVLRTLPEGFAGTRSPLQVGAELFGHDGPESDFEVISLMLETFKLCGLDSLYMDLGHVAIFRSLVAAAGLDAEEETRCFDMLQRKSLPELAEWAATKDNPAAQMIAQLAELYGGPETLEKAKAVLAAAPQAVQEALARVEQVQHALSQQYPQVDIHYDFAELRGYDYHTGIVFAVFAPGGEGRDIARGGRYNNVGNVFNSAVDERPATGFSTDLRQLMRFAAVDFAPPATRVFVPASADAGVNETLRELREQGYRVVRELPGQIGDAAAMSCSKALVQENDQWVMVDVK